MAVEHINENDTLNAGRVKINAALDSIDASAQNAVNTANQAASTANNAVSIANDAKTQAQSTQTQLDNIIIENGQSDAEIVQARTKEDGTTFPLLKDRLNAMDTLLTLKEKIKFDNIFLLDAEDTHTIAQGMCVTNDSIVYAAITNNENDSTYLVVIDKISYEKVNVIKSYNFEHANSLAFNPDNNTIAIAHCINNSVQSNKLSIIDASLLRMTEPQNLILQTITFDFTVQAVGYYDGHYYLVHGDQKTVTVVDSNFNFVRTFELGNSVVVQGLDIYKNLIFVTRYNIPEGTLSQDVLYTGFIDIYDLNGNYIKKWNIPLQILGGEIESFCHLGDGRFISNFNGDKHYFYISEVCDLNSSYTVNEVENYFPVNIESKTIYVDADYSGAISDGTIDRPFKNLEEVKYYLHKLQSVVPVRICLKGVFNKGETFHSIRHSLRIEAEDGSKVPWLYFQDCMQVILHAVNIYGCDSNNKGVTFDHCQSAYIEGCTIDYTSGDIPSGYTPFYSLASTVTFDNGMTTINNAKYVALQATSSTINVFNGLIGTNNAMGMRLKNSILFFEPGSFDLGTWNNIIIGGSKISANDEILWSGIAYTGTINFANSIDRYKKIKIIYESNSFFNEYQISVSQLSSNKTRSIHEYNLPNNATTDIQYFELQMTINNTNLTIDINSKLDVVGDVKTKYVYPDNRNSDYIRLLKIIGEY